MLQFLKQVLILILEILLLVGISGSLLGFLGQYHQIFELLSHFRFLFFEIQLAAAIGMLFFNRKWAFTGMVLLLPALFTIWPYSFFYLSKQELDNTYDMPHLRLLNLNVLKENHEYNRVIELLRREKPDIIALQEPNAEWFHALKPVLKTYPYQLEIPQENNFGIGLYSKIPLKNIQVKYFAQYHQFPAILAEAQWKGHSFHLLTVHPIPPLSGFSIRNQQLQSIAEERVKWKKSLIVMGDLNLSQWSYYFRELLDKTHLKDTQLGEVQLSWPAYSQWIKIPIDHVLVSEDWLVEDRYLGPNVGSDHLPVIVDLKI